MSFEHIIIFQSVKTLPLLSIIRLGVQFRGDRRIFGNPAGDPDKDDGHAGFSTQVEGEKNRSSELQKKAGAVDEVVKKFLHQLVSSIEYRQC